MEQDRFDALAISLADEGTSRRSVLGRLAAGGVAAALGITAFAAFEDEDAEAKKCKKKCKKKEGNAKKRCKRKCKKKATAASCSNNTNCAGGQICINARCTSTCTGAAQCASGQVCLNGACTTACSTSTTCGGGQVCVNGGCTNACVDNGDCTGGQVCIQGVCGTPNTPPNDPAVNLCDADAQCPGGICLAGVCVLGCTTNAECTGALVCGNLLGTTGPKVCIAPATPCSSSNPCTGGILSACVLGICVELG